MKFDIARNKLNLNIWEQTVFLFKTFTAICAPVGCLSITKLALANLWKTACCKIGNPYRMLQVLSAIFLPQLESSVVINLSPKVAGSSLSQLSRLSCHNSKFFASFMWFHVFTCLHCHLWFFPPDRKQENIFLSNLVLLRWIWVLDTVLSNFSF